MFEYQTPQLKWFIFGFYSSFTYLVRRIFFCCTVIRHNIFVYLDSYAFNVFNSFIIIEIVILVYLN